MKLHYRLLLAFSTLWLLSLTALAYFLADMYAKRALDNERQVAFSQGTSITSRLTGLLPTFPERAHGYADYYSRQLNVRLILLTPDPYVTYDTFREIDAGRTLSLSIFQDDEPLPRSVFHRTESFGYVQYALFAVDHHRELGGYLLLIKDANVVDRDVRHFRNQVIVLLGAALVCGFVVFYFLASWFTRPIRRMIVNLKQITPQKRQFGMTYRRNDEIGQLVSEIKQMVDQIREYEQRQRRFISTSSHELKTPLATIQLILENLPYLREHAEQHAEYITDLQAQIDRMKKIVQGMLNVYKLADKQLELSPLNLDDIRSHAEKQFQHLTASKRIKLAFEGDRQIALVVDRDSFFEGLNNLISNAIHYSPQQTTVRISISRRASDRICCAVCDQGKGIADKDVPYIFEPFYRANEAIGWNEAGSGLGLAIVKQMVELHRGEIEVVSSPGEGTCVTMVFPITNRTM